MRFVTLVCNFCQQALLLLLYIVTTSICQKRNSTAAEDDDDDDDEAFMGTVEKQPLLRDDQNIRQYTANQQQPQHYALVDNSQGKLAGDI